jgi:hypothetical protein
MVRVYGVIPTTATTTTTTTTTVRGTDAETVVVTARVLKSCQAENKSPLPHRSADRSLP